MWAAGLFLVQGSSLSPQLNLISSTATFYVPIAVPVQCSLIPASSSYRFLRGDTYDVNCIMGSELLG